VVTGLIWLECFDVFDEKGTRGGKNFCFKTLYIDGEAAGKGSDRFWAI